MSNIAELVERYVALNHAGDIDGVLDCCSDDILFETVVNPRGSVRLIGKAQVREVLEGALRAFANREHQLVSLLVQANRAATETIFTGVAQAELGDGVMPGDQIAIRGATIFEEEDGKIVRICDYS